MRTQVARSKGTEWMVSSYIAWQERSPLPKIPERKTLPLMRLTSRLAQKEKQYHSVLSVSYRSVLSIIGFLMSVKIR
jgi:hypothetical protein